jgi:hypothetical protein
LALAASLAAGDEASSEPSAAPEIRDLELVARFRSDSGPSTLAYDVRAADERSIFVLRLEDGVSRNALEPGLPVIERVLPGLLQDARIETGQTDLAVSSEFVLTSALGVTAVWREMSRSLQQFGFQRMDQFIASDVDLWGDEISALGLRLHRRPGGTVLG